MSQVFIYALLHDCGLPRYIGRSIRPEKRLREHWNSRVDERSYWYGHPLCVWLRLRSEPPAMRVIAVVELQRNRREDWPFIIAAREAFPGKLVNLHPVLANDAPEWDLFDRLARWENPDFNINAFRAQVQHDNRLARSDRLREKWQDPEFDQARRAGHSDYWADPEHKAAQSERATRVFSNIPREVRSAALKRRWEDPAYRMTRSEQAKAQWANPETAPNRGRKV